MSQPQPFGEFVKEHRLAVGLTQAELALRAQVSERTVSYLEQGKINRPRKDTVQLLTAALTLANQGRSLHHPVASSERHNLPAALTSFIGRERETAALRTLLERETRNPDVAGFRVPRLLTLTGAGGSGKTRLALQVAGPLVDSYPDGVWFVELAGFADPLRVPQAVAAVLGVRERQGQSLLDALLTWLRGKRLLLVLDNCEHLIDACARLVDTILRRCPEVRVLATSREALRVEGEVVRRVPTLGVTPEGAEASAEAVAAVEAVRLFAARAALVAEDFVVTAANAGAVAAICRRLDGLPLTIELAAARLGGMSVDELAARLAESFELLDNGPRAAAPRQQGLWAALDWSYDPLPEAARALLRRLAIFAGGWPGEAVESDEGLPLLLRLVNASLVQMERQGGTTRYRLLETVRAYALAQLRAADEVDAAHARHLAWCLRLAEEAEPHLESGAAHLAWLQRLDLEYDNLRVALDWALAHDVTGGLCLAGRLRPYWLVRRYQVEGRAWLAALLERDETPTGERAVALYALGYLSVWHDLPTARTQLEAALALAQRLDDQRLVATLLPQLIYALVVLGERAAVAQRMAEAQELLRARDDDRLQGMLILFRGYVAEQRGDLPAAQQALEEALGFGQRAEFPFLICLALTRLGFVRLLRGYLDEAEADFWELLAVAGRVGADRYQTQAHTRLGIVAELADDLPRARASYVAGLTLAEAHGDEFGRMLSRSGLGRIALRQGEYPLAITLFRAQLAAAARLKDPRVTGELLRFLWVALWRRGETLAALATLQECLALWQREGFERNQAELLEGLAFVVAEQGDDVQAALWLGTVDAVRQARGLPRPPVDAPRYTAVTAQARRALGDAAYAATRVRGRELPLQEAVASAVAWAVERGASLRSQETRPTPSVSVLPVAFPNESVWPQSSRDASSPAPSPDRRG